MLSDAVREKIEGLLHKYPTRESALMPALQAAQAAAPKRYVDDEDLAEVARLVGVPLAKAYGVKTFYTMYHSGPVGRYHIEVDTNIPGLLAGANAILDHLKKKLGIDVGGVTPDGMFSLGEVEDLGSCGTCPVVQVGERYFENMTTGRVDELLDCLRRGAFPDWAPQDNFATTSNILLKRRGKPGAGKLAVYEADGGYKALAKALTMKPAEIVAAVKDSTIRGRGGAGFPMGMKWGFLAKDTGKPSYLVCNADEGEPGTFKDRQIMEFDPHLLIEGMAISGYAIGSKLGFIYIRGEFGWIADILDAAIDEARDAGRLGRGILGTDAEFDIIVHRGAGAYVCGEETALIESLEGKRGNPRRKPPFPAVEGLYGCPTVVNNVETLACVPFIVSEGAAAFKAIGTPGNAGPKLYGISGHVKRPGVYEYPLGVPLETLLEAAGGVQGRMKGVIVGGLSVPILTADEAKGLAMDYDSCLKRGTMLGSGGVMVLNESASIPEVALRAIRFYAHESCGQCTPCRQGSGAVQHLLQGIVEGRGTSEDLDRVLSLCRRIRGSTLCPTGEAFASPIEAMIVKFRSEFEALVRP